MLVVGALSAIPHATAQVISTIAGGATLEGYSASAISFSIQGIGLGPDGTVHFVSGLTLYKVGPDSGIIRIAGSDAAGNAPEYVADGAPVGQVAKVGKDFAIDRNGNIFFVDGLGIRRVGTDGIVHNVAGNGVAAVSGDGGPAIAAQVHLPSGLVSAADGSLYFFDFKCIRRIDPHGIITTIARWQGGGYGGDGGSALLGNFYGPPSSMAVDAQGNVFVADAYNRRVRRIGTDGILSTVAGNGTVGFSGDGGPATAAAINIPIAVAVDATGNLYIGDLGNRRIRLVTPDGRISTIAGTGEYGFAGDGGAAVNAQLSSITGLAVDAAGTLYFSETRDRTSAADGGSGVIADIANSHVRRIQRNGTITRVLGADTPLFAGDGNPATSAFGGGEAVVDRDGSIYFVDGGRYRVRRISPAGRISTVAGNGLNGQEGAGDGGPATAASFNQPRALALDAVGNIYVADGRRVRRIDRDGVIRTFAGPGNAYAYGDGGPAMDAYLGYINALAFDAGGNLVIAAEGRVRRVSPQGTITSVTALVDGPAGTTVKVNSPTPPAFAALSGMTFDPSGNLVFANDAERKIFRLQSDGNIVTIAGSDSTLNYGGDGGPATLAVLGSPRGRMAYDLAGNLYFGDQVNNRVRRVSPQGVIDTFAGTGEAGFGGDGGPARLARVQGPRGVAIGGNGDVYFAVGTGHIRKVSTGVGANYSDMWWAGTAENGWGMSIQQHAGGVQFVALYVYDNAGQPRWYAMPGGTWADNFTTYAGPLFQPTSAPLNAYQAGAFSAGAPVGSATIHFTASNVAELSYVIGGIAGGKRMTRMNFGGSDPVLDVGDMWWGGVAENGWGISISQQGGTLFSVWYTYGPDGKAIWFPMPGGTWSNRVYAGPIYSTQGSRWLGANYDPAMFRVGPAGNMRLDFSDPSRATVSYEFTAGPFAGTNQTKPLSRMAY